MKSKLTNRILAALCVAIVLSVLLALTSFAAEIKGGYGMIEGVDDTYKAASATINDEGTALKVDTANAIVLDANANKDLAGLYAVSNDDFATKTLVYVYGKSSARTTLGEKWNSGDTNPFDEDAVIASSWVNKVKHGSGVDKFAQGYLTHNSTFYTNHNLMAESHFSNEFITKFYAAADTTAKQAVVDEYKDSFTNLVYRYALTNEEIIPVSLVKKINFGYNGTVVSQFTFKTVDSEIKFVAYVMDPDGTVTAHNYYIDYPSQIFNGNNYNAFEVDFQKTEKWDTAFPEDGVVLAYAIYPYYGLTSADNFIISHTQSTIPSEYGYRARGLIYNPTWVVSEPKAEAPTGITIEGKVFKGLDPAKSYAVAPYTVAGALNDQAVKVSGVSEFDVTAAFDNPVGLYGIYIEGGEYYDNSQANVVYIEGKWAEREELGTIKQGETKPTASISKDIEWIAGDFLGTKNSGSVYKSNKGYTFMDDWGYSISVNNIKEATASGDPAKLESAKKEVIAALQQKVIRYAYTPDDILPVGEFERITLASSKFAGCASTLKVSHTTPKFSVFVMDEAGNVSEHTWTGTRMEHTYAGFNDTNTFTVDIQSIEGLPTEGWVVGFKYHPYGELALEDVSYTGVSTSGNFVTCVLIGQGEGNYDITKKKYAKPEGITVEGLTLKGLDANKVYNVAPCTLLGIDDAKAITVTGVTEYTFDRMTQGGLWGLVNPSDDYFMASEPVYVYVSGVSSTRKELGTLTEKTYTWNSGADSKTIEVPTGTKVKESAKVWEIGSYLGSDYYFYNGGDHYSMKSDWMYDPTSSKALYEAELAGEDALKAEREKAQKVIQEISNRYAFTSDEIIPITEVFEMTFTRAAGTVEISVKNGAAKYVFMIMNPEDGSITEYVHIGEYKAFGGDINNSSRVEKLDIRELVKTGVLPSEGLLVGYKYYPLGVVNLEDITYKDQTGTRTQFAIDTRFPHAYFTGTYVIKEEAPTPVLKTFPVILNGYGEISGLNPNFIYEVQYYDETTSTWSEWDEIDAGSTAFRVYNAGNYRVRIVETDDNLASEVAEVTVKPYTSDYKPYKSQILTMHLPNDFVELSAEYEMDVTVKNWVSSLALENIKSVAPESTIKILGDGYKFIVTAKNINLEGNKTHYFDMSVAFDGTSRFDKVYNNFKALAGEKLLKEVYFESTSALPFEEAEFVVFVGEDKTGADVELRSYNSRINKLRKVETSTVIDGWVTFTNYAMPYVILQKN